MQLSKWSFNLQSRRKRRTKHKRLAPFCKKLDDRVLKESVFVFIFFFFFSVFIALLVPLNTNSVEFNLTYDSIDWSRELVLVELILV